MTEPDQNRCDGCSADIGANMGGYCDQCADELGQSVEDPKREPGFYGDVPEAEYHADRDSLSVSGAKLILEAPARFRYRQDNPEHKDVFDIGSAAHALVLGIGAEIGVVDADDWRSKDAREARDNLRELGKTPLLRKDARRVEEMADKLSSHRLAMRLLSDGEPEVSAYAVDEPTGVMRRCRFDWLGTNVLTDYKTAASANPRDLAGHYGAIKKWSYDAQTAWYLDLARDLGHPASAFAFIVQEKEPPYLVTVAYLDEADLWQARENNARALEVFRDCTASGEWPGYLPDDAAALVSLTDQTFRTEYVA